MKVMVFGSSAYLAKFIISKLAQDGHDVLEVYRFNHVVCSESSNVLLLNENFSNLRQLVSQNEPDVVLNLTNYFTKNSQLNDISKLSQINCLFITELAQACLLSKAIFFQIGSAWQANFNTQDPSLGNIYALYKGLANQILSWFENSFGLRVFRLNLYDTYGPGDSRGKIVQFLIEQINSQENLELSGGDQILELVHVNDVASAISCGITHINTMLISNISFSEEPIYWCLPPKPVTLRKLVEVINQNISQPLNVSWGKKPYRQGELFQRDGVIRQTIPGWKTKISIKSGISSLIQNLS